MRKFENVFVPIVDIPDAEARKQEHCLCASCKHSGICRYYSKFIEYQQKHFPAKIDCYKYERDHLVTQDIFELKEAEQ